MIIYFGADHRGVNLKNDLLAFVKGLGYEVLDVYPNPIPEDDYPDVAGAVAKKVAEDPENGRGVVICASGAGMDIAANKVRGIRAALGLGPDQIFDARHDDDVNILALASDFEEAGAAEAIVRVFLNTPFSGEERFQRRIQKIKEIENWPRIV
jgi:ribose 5-phosphate isomerase B